MKKLFLIMSLIFCNNCFEYEETINFKKGFSGFVEISYTVPLHNKSETSLIKFLPITENEINNRINKGLFSKNLKVKDFNMRILDKTEIDGMFSKKAKVNYKLDFGDITILDGVLIGSIFIKKKNQNSISIKREFKSVLKTIDQNSTTGEKKIFSETARLLGDGHILFKVNFPLTSECRSNKGEISLGNLNYKLPLIETIEKVGNKSWDYSITTIY